ncbi:MAG: TetR/AcrR family transcriptional regulator [Acidobacteria bacterium]|nr:TetR/AcrR family transcriptional regulator [Acidobacteriota bacterium]
MHRMPRQFARSRPGPRGKKEQTRAAILHAALHEFATEGVEGARTEAIARAAGVNKALLYYYFRNKETLYGAVLDQVFSGLFAAVGSALDRPLPPREKVLAWAGAHFDYVASEPIFPRVVLREMMRAGRAGSPHIRRIAQKYLRPIQARLAELFRKGIAAGDFRAINPQHFIVSVVAMNVFYFGAAPMLREMMGQDPLSRERVADRRAAVLDTISAALFTRPDGNGPRPQRKRS